MKLCGDCWLWWGLWLGNGGLSGCGEGLQLHGVGVSLSCLAKIWIQA